MVPLKEVIIINIYCLCHMEGETNAITGSTSNLPIIMHIVIVILLKFENCEKLPKGPISSNPEPVLLIDAKAYVVWQGPEYRYHKPAQCY